MLWYPYIMVILNFPSFLVFNFLCVIIKMAITSSSWARSLIHYSTQHLTWGFTGNKTLVDNDTRFAAQNNGNIDCETSGFQCIDVHLLLEISGSRGQSWTSCWHKSWIILFLHENHQKKRLAKFDKLFFYVWWYIIWHWWVDVMCIRIFSLLFCITWKYIFTLYGWAHSDVARSTHGWLKFKVMQCIRVNNLS